MTRTRTRNTQHVLGCPEEVGSEHHFADVVDTALCCRARRDRANASTERGGYSRETATTKTVRRRSYRLVLIL
jgi:hypothetical protein